MAKSNNKIKSRIVWVKKFVKYLLILLIPFFFAAPYLSCSNQNVNPVIPNQGSLGDAENSYSGSLKDYIKSLNKPVMVDFGSTGCVPCKMMEPILEDLKNNYYDKFETIFINVSKDLESTREFSINVIPTQIFFDSDGKELFRHIGFFSKEDILKTFTSYGISIQ